MQSLPSGQLQSTGWLLLIGFLSSAHVICAEELPAVENAEVPVAIDFERHVAPLLTRLGCNAGSCHGASEGQGGLKLSLFGGDREFDFEALADPVAGRIDLETPTESLFLQKPTLQVDHDGGERLKVDSFAYQVIRRWIEQRAKQNAGSGTVARLEVLPATVLFSDTKKAENFRVVATFSDGEQLDVTAWARVRILDDSVTTLEGSSTLVAGSPGDTAVVAQFNGHPAHAMVFHPYPESSSASKGTAQLSAHPIDNAIEHKLQLLRLDPLAVCDDYTFLRRLTLSTTGQLPTPEEITAFVADASPDKRDRAIDRCLEHSLHASLLATRWCEILGSRDNGMQRTPVRSEEEEMWHRWLRARFQDNLPYDQLARQILTATTRDGAEPDAFIDVAIDRAGDEITREMDGYEQKASLDLFWMRPSQNEEITTELLSERIAAAFIGQRIQCAKCHNHPFDRWTQVDFRAFTNLFSQVQLGQSAELRLALANRLEARRENPEAHPGRIPSLKEVYVAQRFRDLRHPTQHDKLEPRVLGGPVLDTHPDRRVAFADWLVAKDNPYFARNLANRVWAFYFGRGLVDPIDAFSAGNPSTHPELLDALAQYVVASDYDIRALERLILTSQTWQRETAPQGRGEFDTRNYAAFEPRILSAGRLVDAIQGAVDNHRGAAVTTSTFAARSDFAKAYFENFSRPERKSTCDCETDNEPTLRQAMLLLSDTALEHRIDSALPQEPIEQPEEFEEWMRQAVLKTLSRPATSQDITIAREYWQTSENKRQAMIDVVWGLLNTREFVTIH